MNVLYFDTETTGLSPVGAFVNGRHYMGQICQLAYIIDYGTIKVAKNFYFAVQHMDMGAAKVTGLSVELVHYLSCGRVFADDVEEIKRDFDQADVVVAHNLNFDCKFMQAEMARCGYPFDLTGRGFCTMQGFVSILRIPGKRTRFKTPSLEELASHYGIDNARIREELAWLYEVDKDAHDARHDTVKMYLAVQEARHQVPELATIFGPISQ